MTTPTTPSPASPPLSPTHGAHPSDRFFLWVAGLGVARSDGWLGGVCAGIAARLRIDPLIVRGVLVVAAIFGLPVLFLYAAAWMLLPDIDGRTHARDLVRGLFQPVQLGILALALIGLVSSGPLTGLFLGPGFGLGYLSSVAPGWAMLSAFGFLIGLTLVVVLLVLIVRASRRTPGASASSPAKASAGSTAPDASTPLGDSGTAVALDADGSDAGEVATAAPASDLLSPPPPAEAGPSPEPTLATAATPDDIEAWRAQHAAWKQQDQAWRRQQQDVDRAARDQARRERQATAAAFSAEAAERRRIRRASSPRARAAYLSAVIGLALVTGAGVGLWSGAPEEQTAAVGALAAALVLAVGMIVAGIARRRSGFLAFLTILVLLGGVIAGGVASLGPVTFGSVYTSNDHPIDMQQPFGDLTLDLSPHDLEVAPIVVEKGSGYTQITVHPGVELDLRATLGFAGTTQWIRVEQKANGEYGEVLDSGTLTGEAGDGSQRLVETITSERVPATLVQPVKLDQRAGDLQITIIEPESGETE